MSSTAKLRLGIVGCGIVARRHAQSISDDRRAELVVCCDPRPEAARGVAQAFAPAAAIESDPDRVFTGYGLDGVILCSPTLEHFRQAAEAIELGLHVLSEKPLAGERWQILALIQASHARNRILSIAHQRRYKSAYRTARRELTENAAWYGTVRQVHVYSCERWHQAIAGSWRDDPRMGAGYFGDAGIHQIDVVHFLTGLEAQQVMAVSDRRTSQVEIATGVLARFSQGMTLVAHFVGDANHWREDIHLHGTEGDLLLRSEELYRAKNNQTERITDLVPDSSPVAAFLDAIETGQPTVSPPEIALPIFDWTQAVLESIHSGCWARVGAGHQPENESPGEAPDAALAQ